MKTLLTVLLVIVSSLLIYQTNKLTKIQAKVIEYQKSTAELIRQSKIITEQSEQMRLQSIEANERVEEARKQVAYAMQLMRSTGFIQ